MHPPLRDRSYPCGPTVGLVSLPPTRNGSRRPRRRFQLPVGRYAPASHHGTATKRLELEMSSLGRIGLRRSGIVLTFFALTLFNQVCLIRVHSFINQRALFRGMA